MKAAAFDYVIGREISDVVAALAAGAGETKLMAGGQSLGPMLNLRLARPRTIVDVSRVDALRRIEDRGDTIWIGASVTHAAIEDGRLGMPSHPYMQSIAKGIAYRAVRNRGTIGGSLAHADPAADWPLALAALDAQVHLHSPRGTRVVAADGFMTGAYATALADDEIIEGVVVPKLSAGARWGYYKFCRKTGEFPEASAAIVLDAERRIARVWVGALDAPPRALPALATQLARIGQATPADCATAIGTLGLALDPIARSLRTRALAKAVDQAATLAGTTGPRAA